MNYATSPEQIAMSNAIKASGSVVQLPPPDFEAILTKIQKPLIIFKKGGFLSANYQYMTSYKGFIFYTKSKDKLITPSSSELIQAERIWIPS